MAHCPKDGGALQGIASEPWCNSKLHQSSAISDSDDITETPLVCHQVSLQEKLLTAGNAQTRHFLCTGSLNKHRECYSVDGLPPRA